MSKKPNRLTRGRKLAKELEGAIWRLDFRRDLLERFYELRAPEDIINRQRQLLLEAVIEYSDARKAYMAFLGEKLS